MDDAGHAGRPSMTMRRPKPLPLASSVGSGASLKDAEWTSWLDVGICHEGGGSRAGRCRTVLRGGKFTPV